MTYQEFGLFLESIDKRVFTLFRVLLEKNEIEYEPEVPEVLAEIFSLGAFAQYYDDFKRLYQPRLLLKRRLCLEYSIGQN